ncbi:hypothetical protein LOC59_09375 [Arthrobacter sp. zg-Y916]|uniref:hypothetical protein n=1 Tax=Arthrobacter sp. zg-Y916 TaxID=2894190 RepID=UPI001E60C3A9|nr:hypothetical protein [Arthrobacter sp. zg-Y916]MCC9193851.1 hypothetical protein [Arthrobacter sp. zg-Y916]
MQFFTTTRRGQVALAAGLVAGVSSLMALFDLWALALAGTAGGLIIINLLIAENVHRSRLSAKISATRGRQSNKGLNSSVARIEGSLSELTALLSSSTRGLPNSHPDARGSVAIASDSPILESIGRVHDFQQWWCLHERLLGEAPQTPTAVALPPALSRLREGQTVLFVGTAATASWVYEKLLGQLPTPGRAYLGFLAASERENFEAFVAEKLHRLDHLSFVLDHAPLPASSMGGLPAIAVDIMVVDFGASESHQEIMTAIPDHYWHWLREETELIVLDSRQGLAARAAHAVMTQCDDFVVKIDSRDPYTRNLKRAAR